MDQAKLENQIIFGHQQECGIEPSDGRDDCLFDRLYVEV